MSCSNRNVNLDNRVGLDDCALAANERQNIKIDEYHLYNPRVDCSDKNYMGVCSRRVKHRAGVCFARVKQREWEFVSCALKHANGSLLHAQ